MTEKKIFRPSFYLTINSLFILFVLFVGGILTWHNYSVTKDLVLSETDQDYDRILVEFSKDFKHTYKPVFETVRLLSMTSVMNASTLDERLLELNLLSTALQNKTEMAGLQVGYANGDYLIVRPTFTGRLRALFNAPESAAYVVDHIATDPASGQRLLERMYYDQQMLEVMRNPPEPSEYDPRTRPWYLETLNIDQVSVVAPYLFYFLQEIGTTVSYHPPGSNAVIAADVTMQQLSETLNSYLLTPSSEIALINAEGSVVGYNKPANIILGLEGDRFKLARIDELKSEAFAFISNNNLLQDERLNFQLKGKRWHGATRTFNVSGYEGRDLNLVMLSPYDELLANAKKTVQRSLLVTLLILLVVIPIASFIAAVISKALNKLAEEAVLVSRFDFRRPIALRSKIKEVDELALSMNLMKNTISRFLALITSLAGEQNFDAMLELITEETLDFSESDGALTWFIDDGTNRLNPGALFDKDKGKVVLEGLPSYPVDGEHRLIQAMRKKETSQIHLSKDAADGLTLLFETLGTSDLVVTALPLRNRQDEEIGLLCLLNRETAVGNDNKSANGRLAFVRTFSGFASVSLESRHLLEMQKRLMDSFMHLLAGAIDTKSAYTGGHCQRVPVLTKMLARAACEDNGLYKDFQLDDKGWEAVHLAGWLHDCGKVTTPEYVVDKATKLETIYDRIHEVRTRFEVLKRDAEIRYWEQVADGGDREKLRKVLNRELLEIDEDFVFVAECNLGGEFVLSGGMGREEIAGRLDKIASRTWKRTLDDRIGVSWEEEKRRARVTKQELPAEENVLADRQDHLIERKENERITEDNAWGFKLDVPEYRYNLGELYNLKVEKGTLTTEERYKINDHIVQTIIMLEKLPYPKHLREVPELAGGHHETMDGKGYPRQLDGSKMSLTARMMAIADIFEALTASDRPYKKAKKLSDTVRIMSFFKKDHHIDPDLFDLFLRSGVYLEYAREYLDPEQIDEVDVDSYLGQGTKG
jgi:HD-GYP domain-containing protein (c-di-GMP phosphodiesterase class II)